MKKIFNLSVLILAGSSLMAQTSNEPGTKTKKVNSQLMLDVRNINKLSPNEKKEGWTLLFDGKTTQGWHTYLMPRAGQPWSVKDGVLQIDPAVKEERGDLVTDKEYENFEFSVDWNIAEEGNSGIIFLIHEDKAYDGTYLTGPEYQLLDDKKAEDNKQPNHLAASLYDMIAPAKEAENPAGEWNHSVIRVKNGELTFWLNGVQTVKTHMWDANWAELVSKSKFKDWKGFASYHKGHISLQDHGGHIEFRNIKIREL